jgi:cellulose synthase/poly-beta-1,6-N-acetylglucosamine synthase-like glycosyltransferase
VSSQVLELMLDVFTVLILALLVMFAARRVLFLIASSAPERPLPSSGVPPTLLVVVPVRNEAPAVGDTLAALARIDYPSGRLQITLVDDCSEDGTADLLAVFAATLGHVRAIVLDVPLGKPGALNAGIAASPRCELVAVCDADQAPRPDCFRVLVRAFVDPTVGAAFGYLAPANADASLIARYAAVETWVHQLVTSAAKDRLDLNPPSLGGGSVYRRGALDEIGGFPERAYGEDIAASVLLSLAGWRTRFLQQAVISNRVVAHWSDYWQQHVRWARTLLNAAPRQRPSAPIPFLRRAETVVQTSGYLDRVALAGSVLLVAEGSMPFWVPLGYLAVAALEVATAIQRGRAGRRSLRFVFATAVSFPLDVAATFAAVAVHLTRRPLKWRSPRRQGAR